MVAIEELGISKEAFWATTPIRPYPSGSVDPRATIMCMPVEHVPSQTRACRWKSAVASVRARDKRPFMLSMVIRNFGTEEMSK